MSLSCDKILILPNFVVLEFICPSVCGEERYRMALVGRTKYSIYGRMCALRIPFATRTICCDG